MRTLNKALRTSVISKGKWESEIFQLLRQYKATPHSTTTVSPAVALNDRRMRKVIKRIDHKNKKRMKQLANSTNIGSLLFIICLITYEQSSFEMDIQNNIQFISEFQFSFDCFE